MSLNVISEMFANEINDADNAIINVNPKRNSIETPLFDITFKKSRVGDIEVDGAKGLVPLDMFNFCDKLVVQIALNAVKARILVCGENAVATDTAPLFQDLFDNDKLKEEYAKKLSDAQVLYAETLYANVTAYIITANEMAKAREEMFPLAKTQLQYAYNSRTKDGIFNLKEAILYRISTNPTLLKLKDDYRKRKENKQDMAALSQDNISKVLGF
jgi:hypothetical protein